jgi:hypothetical protein
VTFDALLSALGYEGSPRFLRRGDNRFESTPGYGHIFRRAQDKAEGVKRWRVEGVYGLLDGRASPERFVPIVYVCNADDSQAAVDLHRLVWNQDVVPYVLVREPKGLRVYAGFHYGPQGKTDAERGVIRALTDFDHVDSVIGLFEASAVDEGRIWKDPHLQVDPNRRVYHRLLRDLQGLDKWLRGAGRLKRRVSHALIGKYVYLRYLRDREILSDDRLELFDTRESEIFGPAATSAGLQRLLERLEEWLNGEIFPFPATGPNAPTSDHVKRVAAVFAGSGAPGQISFNFKAYDFSYIPIETLSLIYEQFLHTEDEQPKGGGGTSSKGRQTGAYYTPLPLVNYMLAELQARHPLKEGMKICDPSCGSGAFLVQAFRWLIEAVYPASAPGPHPSPADLKRLLQASIFGVDVDQDACQVTQLSLLLTLLDYVHPPDLTGKHIGFKLPSLIGRNIFETNFFGVEPALRAGAGEHGFDWVVGNPPWRQLKQNDHAGDNQPVWEWMGANVGRSPVGMYQTAQAFAWDAPRYLAPGGECALLLPAMGLFEEPSRNFRAKFFRHFQVHAVANFANLAEVLFDGRSRVPAAALFYRLRPDETAPEGDEAITTYSPLVANQEATRPLVPGRRRKEPTRPLVSGRRRKLWSLVVNGGEIQTIDLGELADGSGLPWKIAMWGTPWDERLIRRLERRWDSFGEIEDKLIRVSEGPELRSTPNRNRADQRGGLSEFEDTSPEELAELQFERVDDWVGKPVLDVGALKRLRRVFSVPRAALKKNQFRFLCLIHGRSGLEVCQPPHLLVSAGRNFSIFSDDFIIVPPRQLGVVSSTGDRVFLKALSLYLSSEFAFYHQFFRSTHFGVKRPVATLQALRRLPVPLASLPRSDLIEWANLHAKLSKCSPQHLHPERLENKQDELFRADVSGMELLLKQLEEMTAQLVGLDDRERALVHDLVRVRLQLDDGKLGPEAMRPPTEPELRAYARQLKEELDVFIGSDADRVHRVAVVRDADSAMVEVDFTRDHESARMVEVLRASDEAARKLHDTRKRLLQEQAQWVYFDRNLRVYRGHQTYLFKPLHRFHWTESAAMMDASDLIAETLGGAN